MTDPRIEQMAKVLVDYSAEIRMGDRVLIEAEPQAEPLVRACFKRILEAGGHPHLFISLNGQTTLTGIDDLFLKYAREEQLDHPATFYQLVYENFESRIRIHSESNTKRLSDADKARLARRERATKGVLDAQLRRGRDRGFRWVTTLFPTRAYAQDTRMSLEEGKERMELRGPNCDLRFSIKGRTFVNAAGRSNMPDGEIFTGPVEDSLEGWVYFSYPSAYRGNEVEGVRLEFEEGRVARAEADKNQAFLDQMLGADEGARYVGEFAFGLNYGVDRITKNILFDEKIGGSIHMALGAGYPETGSRNTSAIHWDLITDMRDGGEILVDGELVYKDGHFII